MQLWYYNYYSVDLTYLYCIESLIDLEVKNENEKVNRSALFFVASKRVWLVDL